MIENRLDIVRFWLSKISSRIVWLVALSVASGVDKDELVFVLKIIDDSQPTRCLGVSGCSVHQH
jgi:hypothetical protein